MVSDKKGLRTRDHKGVSFPVRPAGPLSLLQFRASLENLW